MCLTQQDIKTVPVSAETLIQFNTIGQSAVHVYGIGIAKEDFQKSLNDFYPLLRLYKKVRRLWILKEMLVCHESFPAPQVG